MKAPVGYVVTAFWNNCHLSRRFIETLHERSHYLWHLVVINNGSTDDTASLSAYLTELKHPHTWIDNRKNLGCAKAWNQGIKLALKANAPIIGVLNNDLKFSKDWDQGLVSFLQKHGTEFPVVSPYTDEQPESGFEQRAARFIARKWNQNHFRRKQGSEALFVRPAVFEKIGLFDERFFVTYEDADFYVRLRAAGIEPVTIGNSVLFHQSMASRKKLPGPFELESQKKFVEKYGTDAVLSELKFRPPKWLRKFRALKDRLGLI
jgi:GT2 family glycosyltransferase